MRNKPILTFLTVLGMLPIATKGQDLHYARVQDLSLWYNPSQKTDREADVRLNYREVRYQNMLSYRSTAVLASVPFSVGSPDPENGGYWSLSAGATLDQSNQNILKNTQAVLGLSYAVPVTGNGHYLSVSLQGSFMNSRLDLTNARFPDQFGQDGLLSENLTRDLLVLSPEKNWFSGHLGVSFFGSLEDQTWSLGASLRDVTSPLIERGTAMAHRLSPTLGLQGGYEFRRYDTVYGLHASANFKGGAYEQLLSLGVRHQTRGTGRAIGGGLAYRLRDALIPYGELRFGQSSVGVYYELNISGIRSAGYTRNGLELSLKQQLTNKKSNK